MDSQKLNDWLQVIGLFGVIASLMFVGLQMRQDHAIARSEAFQARTDATVEHLAAMSSNEIFASAIDKIASGNEVNLLASERLALINNDRATFFIFENLHYQYTNGFITAERWSGVKQNIRYGMINRAGFRANYETFRSSYQESFRLVVDGILDEIDAENGA